MKNSKFKLVAGLLSLSLVLAACGNEKPATEKETEPVIEESLEDAPVEDAPAEDAPAEDAPAEDAPAEDAPAE